MNKYILCLLAAATLSIAESMAEEKIYLHSDNYLWKVCPQSEVGDISTLSDSDFRYDSKWVRAVVPGTVFNSYVVDGLEKDPNFGDNIHNVDKSKYDRSFCYRTTFDKPSTFDRKIIWLNFNGINRKGDIYLNGHHLGTLDGFMHRGKFDVTGLLNKSGNILIVVVDIPRQPLANQGSPNYLSSAGWDWMPYVPGLNSGITDKVYLTNTDEVSMVDPWIRTSLPSRACANLTISADVCNNSNQKIKATVRGTIVPGNIIFEKEVDINASSSEHLTFDKRYYPQLVVNQPRLWWPNGYGEPFMYSCKMEVLINGKVSESKDVAFGIRQYSYDKKNNTFHIYINGMPVFVKGANWGMSEYMLRCRGNEYYTKVRLHKEMHFNMIRNWLGSVTDDEFYEACDKYGIMIWDDFWINSNTNVPYDLNAFNDNMIEKIKRLRNHPCVAVWCGDNEANPEPPLEGWMAEDIKTFDGGDRYFQPNSHAQGLTGSGPWGAFDPTFYFVEYPDGMGGEPERGWGFRSEIGTAVVPTFESFKKFMPEKDWWPRNEMWNKHYFGQNAFNAAPDRYDASIEKSFGKPTGIEDYCRKAQLINIESNKAMYEGWLDRMWDDASGIMTWMGQSAYPSMVWQTYDYYYDLTGAYWGAKSACEPIHIFWNPITDGVKIANTSNKDMENVTAEVNVYNLDGKQVMAYNKRIKVSSPSNSTLQCFTIDFNKEHKILSFDKPAYASSTSYGQPSYTTDGNKETRWAAEKADNEWIYVDLGSVKPVTGVRIDWEAAYGKGYKIQVSDDAVKWKEIYKTTEGKGGTDVITFPEVETRYVRMLGTELGWWYGYSMWSFDILGRQEASKGLSDVHFIRLTLKDNSGNIISENNYWRSNNNRDFKALNGMPKANLKVTSKLVRRNGKAEVEAKISNPSSNRCAAFAVHLQAVRTSDGERILPAIMSNNYFTLMSGETKNITITFDESLLNGSGYKLSATPYNNK